MARRKANGSDGGPLVDAADEAGAEPVFAAHATDEPAKAPRERSSEPIERLSIPIRDGKIAWDRMRGTTREQAERVLGARGGAAPVELAFDPALLDSLYDMVASAAVTVARSSGCTVDQAELLRVSADEKAALRDPTMRVIQKYAPTIGPYADEIALAATVALIVGAKATALRAAMAAPQAH